MEGKNIMEYLFERAQDTSDFRSSDEILKNYVRITSKTDDALNTFINKKIAPYLRKALEKLIEQRDESFSDCYYRENSLYYEKGFSDALNLIFLNIISDKDCSI